MPLRLITVTVLKICRSGWDDNIRKNIFNSISAHKESSDFILHDSLKDIYFYLQYLVVYFYIVVLKKNFQFKKAK